VLQGVAACCSVLQRVAACCSVLQRIAACCSTLERRTRLTLSAASSTILESCFFCVAGDPKASSTLLQCVAVCCSVLQCVAVCCGVCGAL